MKQLKLILALFSVVLLSNTIYAQNGGQYVENGSIKIEQIGYSNSQAIIKITNKQSCTATEKVDGLITRTKSIASLSSDTMWITPSNNLKIRAKTETNCGATDFGNVELNVNTVLALTFEYLTAKQVDKDKILVEFKVSDSDGEDRFDIEFSFDGGKTYKTVAVILSSPIIVNQIYKQTITVRK